MSTLRRISVTAIAGIMSIICPGDIVRTSLAHTATSQTIEFQQVGETESEQRREAWAIVAGVTHTTPSAAALIAGWHHTEDVFASSSGAHDAATQSSEPQIIIFTLFNEPAFQHIRRHELQNAGELARLQSFGAPDRKFPHDRTIPPMPDGAVVLLTAWWPVARHGVTAMPVWDAGLNPPLRGGNNYMTWERNVAVDPAASNVAPASATTEFAGRRFSNARRVSLDSFQHIYVDQRLASQTMFDGLSRKAAVIALGRPLQAGDSLALVAMHVVAKQAGKWVWATLWWHDQPDRGPFAEDRPSEVQGAWRNYLLDTPNDPGAMRANERRPNSCFNPWLEARFPDAGAGGGTSSNCIACHQRASYPAVSFLPATRGTAEARNDPAYAPGRLRTDMLWSLARRSGARASAAR